MQSINELYLDMRRTFRAQNIPMPELCARELVVHAGGADEKKRTEWQYQYLADATVQQVQSLADRLVAGEPLAYILGEWDFMGHTFLVNPNVLIPRSDTEPLCELAIACTAQTMNARVLDLCAGTGCIGLSMLCAVPDARVVGVDISDGALAVMRENARRLQVADRYTAVRGNALESPVETYGRFDVIVCNPPYITAEEMDELDSSVRDFEPELALYGGTDGLTFYRAIAQEWKMALVSGGTLFLECGYAQGELVADILRTNGFVDVLIRTDLCGVPRIVIGSLPYDEPDFTVLKPI